MGQSQSHVESSESAPPVEAVIPATVDEAILTPASLASPVEEAPVEETSAPPASPASPAPPASHVTPAAEAPVEEAPVEAPASPAAPSLDNMASILSSIKKAIASVISSSQEAPVTEAPVTEAPVTEAPVTEAPVTEAPVTEAPVTEAPVTEAPVTEAPVQEAPVKETVTAPAEAPQRKIKYNVRITPISFKINRAPDTLRLEE